MAAMNPILVTGAAGFIGFHVARRLTEAGRDVIGVDNLSPYYDPKLKDARLRQLAVANKFRFVKQDLADRAATEALFAEYRFPLVVHLAAQAGVRHSLVDPHAYADANLTGFVNVLEGCRHNGCRHLALCVVVVGLRPEYAKCRFARPTMSIIRSACTAPRKKRTN